MNLTLNADDTLEISTVRSDDELGALTMKIVTNDGEVTIQLGRFHDDACTTRDILLAAAKEIESDIIEGWEDRPDEHDAWIFDADREPGYYVRLEGSLWDGDVLVPHNAERHVRPFLTMDIACYELARAMSDRGYFPNVWHENERGNTWAMDEEVRKFHDEGGDGVVELEGVTFEEGAEIIVKSRYQTGPMTWETTDERATVVKDYGTLGIVYRETYAERDEHTDDRDSIVLAPAEEED